MFNLSKNPFFNFENPELSEKFQDWNWKNNRLHISIASIVSAIVYLFYYQINRIVAPEDVMGYMLIVQVSVVPLMLFFASQLARNANSVYYNRVASVLVIIPIIIAMTVLSIVDEIQNKYMYLSEIYFIMFWIFAISGIRLLHATISATIVLILSFISTLLIFPLPVNVFILHTFWMTLSFSFGFYIAYKIEHLNKAIFMGNEGLIASYVEQNLKELTEVSDVEIVIKREISRYERYDHSFSALLLNIDHFEDIGQMHGKQIQALILVELSIILKEYTRLTDIIIPLENHDFFILYQETDKDTVMKLANKLHNRITSNSFKKVENINISIGLVSHLKHDTYTSIMSRCESALAMAKLNKQVRIAYL